MQDVRAMGLLFLARTIDLAKTKATPRQLAVQALSRALANPAPKLLHGAKGKGFFDAATSAPAKQAAQICLSEKWLEPAGQFEGKGKIRKELYRITAQGIREALDSADTVVLLRDSLLALDQNSEQFKAMNSRIEEMLGALENQKTIVSKLLEKQTGPDVANILKSFEGPGSSGANSLSPPDKWGQIALEYLADYQRRNPYGHCPLPELFHHVAESRGLSIGQFHDGIRQMVAQKQVRLHAFTGALYQLHEEQFALVAGQEIKYYVERLAHP